MSSPAENPQTLTGEPEPIPYWCYTCNKQVSIEPNPFYPTELVCKDCKHGFVEQIVVPAPPLPRPDSTLNHQFLNVLRLIAQASQTDPLSQMDQESPESGESVEIPPWYDVIQPDVSDPPEILDLLGVHLDGLAAVNGDYGEGEGEDDDSGEESAPAEPPATEDYGVGSMRRRRDFLRLRMEGINRAAQEFDWLEILQGLEENGIELDVNLPESGEVMAGNPDDYVDAAGYEVLMHNFAETDSAWRGAPPASKSAVLGLPSVVVGEESPEILKFCAICKDGINVGESCRKLPCDHVYHGDCIVTWLGSRNSCPVCRFELPTDDSEYEELKKKRGSGGGSGSGGGGGGGSDGAPAGTAT